MTAPVNRRDFLKAGGAALGALALPGAAWGALPGSSRTRHVLLIAFAGGVRSRDTIGTPQNVPRASWATRRYLCHQRLQVSPTN